MTDATENDHNDMEITPTEVAALRADSKGCLLLDCRPPEEHEFCALDDSLLMPMDEVEDRLDELEAHREQPIVVYCRTGRRSLVVAQQLREAGYGTAVSLNGGINRWSDDIDSSIPKY